MTGDERPPFRGVPEHEQPAWWRAAMAFVAGLADIPWLHPDGDPDPAWRLFATRTEALAAWDKTPPASDAAYHAAWDAAWSVTRDAAYDAASDVAYDAAWDAARKAAWDATWDAARDAAWDAAYDAALMAAVLVCGGLPVEARHVEHARARMRVWEKGYGLSGDIDGVLYVYEGLA